MKILKRDGREAEFNSAKIEKAILKAFIAVDGEVTDYAKGKAENITSFIESYAMKENRALTVTEIQDLVENGLMSTKRKDVARAYITYRHERDRVRTRQSDLGGRIREKLYAHKVDNQNANVDEKSFGGRIGEATAVQMKDIALNDIMSEMSRNNHLGNMIYIHDLDSYAVGMHNCLSVPFDDILAKGFNTRQTDVRPANSINTAFQLVAVIFQLQSLQQFGGVSATHLDWTMVPYIRKSFYKHYIDGLDLHIAYIYGKQPNAKQYDDLKLEYRNEVDAITDLTVKISEHMLKDKIKDISIFDKEFSLSGTYDMAFEHAYEKTEKETLQAVEGMYHNLNTLQSRSGNQLPFTSINYGTCTLPEGRMVIKALLEGSLKGVGKFHKTSIFPCGIFQCMKGVNRAPGEPNYDLYQLALKSTAQRLYPNYANVDWSGNAGYDINDPTTYFSTMGCRTVNGYDINGFGQRKDGRGNICPVTIIMPTLAMIAKEKIDAEQSNNCTDKILLMDAYEDEFIKLLADKISEAKDMLIERFEWICSQSPESAKFMYENGMMAGYEPEQGIRSALKHGTLVIGQLGLAETLQILIGCDHTEPKGMELAKRIEQLFKDKCAQYKEEYKLNFGVYYTPAENLCFTAMKKFQDKYGKIENVSDRDFFTNSMHVPVWKSMSPFEKIDIESQLTGYSSAGCITYVELEGGIKNNLEALETIVNYAMDKDIPYFAVNVPNDTCLSCGYCDEFNTECPECGGHDIQQLRRVTGYLTGNYTTAFNDGKIQETEMRVKHK